MPVYLDVSRRATPESIFYGAPVCQAALLQRKTAKPNRREYEMKTTIHCRLLYAIAAVIVAGGLAGCGSDGPGSSGTV